MSRKEIKQIAKVKFKDHWGVLLLVLALDIVAEGIAAVIGFGVGSLIVFGPLTIGIYYVYLSVIRNKETDWKDMFFGFRNMFADSFAIGALFLLLVALPVMIIGFGGFLLAIALGLATQAYTAFEVIYVIVEIATIVVAVILSLAYAEAPILLLHEPGIKPMDAMKKSRRMMQGKKGALFIFWLSYLGWFILCLLTLGLLSIYVEPYYWYAKTMFLEQIYKEKCGVSMDDDRDMQKLLALKENVKSKTDSVAGKVKEKKDGHDSEPESHEDTSPELPTDTEDTAPKEKHVCRFCGAKLPEGASFCGRCGRPQ